MEVRRAYTSIQRQDLNTPTWPPMGSPNVEEHTHCSASRSGSHTQNQTFLYHLFFFFFSKQDLHLQTEAQAVYKTTWTSDWDNKPIKKLFTEVINQVRSRVIFS